MEWVGRIMLCTSDSEVNSIDICEWDKKEFHGLLCNLALDWRPTSTVNKRNSINRVFKMNQKNNAMAKMKSDDG